MFNGGSLLSKEHPLVAPGAVNILRHPRTAIFCSNKCPGDLILRTYDLARDMRDAGVTVIGGFHSLIEKEALLTLLKGKQPIIICLARSLEGMRIPAAYREPLEEGRLLLLSPFDSSIKRSTSRTAMVRNRLAAALAENVLFIHAEQGGKLEQLCGELLREGKAVYTLDHPANEHLIEAGVQLYDLGTVK